MSDIVFLEKSLAYTLESTRLFDGQVIEIRQRVDSIKGGLTIEIYSNEHAPVHFHVKNSDINASFKIDNCEYIEGKISADNIKKVQYWYNSFDNRQKLIDAWNKTRPDKCPVGGYKENA